MTITILPAQTKGTTTGASTHTESPTRHAAILLFEEAKKRLLDVNKWDKLCGPASAVFTLVDRSGHEVKGRTPEVGDFIRISLPATANSEGDGYDWVRIEAFENSKDLLKDEEIFGFRVRPSKKPEDKTGGETAHFYTSEATSTFIVVRVSSIVTAMEKGRNEVVNKGPFGFLSKIRNMIVGMGARLGFSQSQWGKLVKGVIKGPPQED